MLVTSPLNFKLFVLNCKLNKALGLYIYFLELTNAGVPVEPEELIEIFTTVEAPISGPPFMQDQEASANYSFTLIEASINIE